MDIKHPDKKRLTISVKSYDFITIGNFKDTTAYFVANGHFYDDVSVYRDSSISEDVVEIQSNELVSIFPNPFHENINITTKRNEFVEVIMYDVTGRKLLQQIFTYSTTLNTEQLAKGIYIYLVRNKNGVIQNGKILRH